MKKVKIFFYIMAAAVFAAISCTKQLELAPVSTISSASFWKTEDDAKGAVYGMYARLRGVTATNLFIWGESRSQNLKQSVGNDFANIRNFDNTLDPTSAGPDWSSVYRVVNDANYILKYIPEIKGFKSDDTKNRYLAEAYTMRAYCYFVMAKTWGDVPVVTEPTSGYVPSEIYKERTPVADVFTLIKKDIDQAISLFPDNNYIAGRNRWTKPGANALKGDVFLWTGKVLKGGNADFNTALTALNNTIASDVSLQTDFNRVFDYDNKGNKEIIMANNFQRFEAPNTFMSFMYIDALPPNPQPAAKAIIGTVGGGSYWTPSTDTRNKFSNDDARKAGSYTDLFSADPVTGLYTKYYGGIVKKFDGMVDAGTRYFIDDVILYRLADVLLMKAEAQNALGQDPSEAINTVRKRAYGSTYSAHVFVNGSKDQNDNAILDERLLELLYEGKYWWDVLRFNKAAERIPYFKTNPGDTYKYLWPLSLNILSLEPKTVQNPGYK